MTNSARELLYDNGSSDNKVEVRLNVSWENQNGTVKLNYTYKDEFVKAVASVADGSTHYVFTLNNYDTVGLDVDTLQIQASIVSASGVTSSSAVYPQSN